MSDEVWEPVDARDIEVGDRIRPLLPGPRMETCPVTLRPPPRPRPGPGEVVDADQDRFLLLNDGDGEAHWWERMRGVSDWARLNPDVSPDERAAVEAEFARWPEGMRP